LAIDKDVPSNEKIKLVGAIVYFVTPFDFIPEVIIGPAGYMDDVVVAAVVLNSLLNKVDAEIVKKHWAGNKDVLTLIQEIFNFADELVGSGLWSRIKEKFGS